MKRVMLSLLYNKVAPVEQSQRSSGASLVDRSGGWARLRLAHTEFSIANSKLSIAKTYSRIPSIYSSIANTWFLDLRARNSLG